MAEKKRKPDESPKVSVLIMVSGADGQLTAYAIGMKQDTADSVEKRRSALLGIGSKEEDGLFYELVNVLLKGEDRDKHDEIRRIKNDHKREEALYDWLGEAADVHVTDVCWDVIKGPFDKVWHWVLM